MNARKAIPTLLGLALAVPALVTCTGCTRTSSAVVSVAVFSSITNIIFTEVTGPESNAWKHVTVGDTNDLRRIISFTQLTTKQPCACAHLHEALFQGPSDDIRVSFCDHCFDVVSGTFAGDYEMPKGFYAEFRKLVQRKSSGEWRVYAP